ncbi:MAG: DUF1028 domain-containing protein [Melioribacteraceae bacterium]|nr:DUF1028 domain-containing protein [Melioribacteraceae bacterium]MCF8354047.1 DUF1028 domain-containing protein [Melioribacteraceae bacterium]MCF8392272.1 DUF1028 domain-containing protein [Melioribacteraceae bacterium]MCF8417604.1 DUF1028 domain-containing protein [Melioribacteraceae bacterium]
MNSLLSNIILISLIFITPIDAQFFNSESPFAHTYSIVARDEISGEMGVAVQSHWFSVGSIVAWGEAGVGVVATQSFVNPSFGPIGLQLLKEGLTPAEAVNKLTAEDNGRDFRQLAILNKAGQIAAYTGNKCIQPAGHRVGSNYSVQANMMKNDKVWSAMAKAFEETEGPLAERMVAALEAAQNAGGDIRGKQSASILVVRGESTGKIWDDRLIDLRVEDHPEPVKEIKRLLQIYRAYEHMNRGDVAVETGNMKKAMEEYSAAEAMFPGNEEMKYWRAITLINNGEFEKGLEILKWVFNKNKDWKELTPRLIPSGLLEVSEEQLNIIMEIE